MTVSKKFTAWFHVSTDVTTFEDKTVEWVDENVLDDLHHDLVKSGFTVDDMGVIEDGALAPAPVTQGMNAYERFACAEYLSAFPDDKTFDEVMQMLLDRNEEVLVWEVFEHKPPEVVLDLIVGLERGLSEQFTPREEVK